MKNCASNGKHHRYLKMLLISFEKVRLDLKKLQRYLQSTKIRKPSKSLNSASDQKIVAYIDKRSHFRYWLKVRLNIKKLPWSQNLKIPFFTHHTPLFTININKLAFLFTLKKSGQTRTLHQRPLQTRTWILISPCFLKSSPPTSTIII